MRDGSGQALLELALCAPVMLVLGLGAVAAVQIFDAESGLQAATDAAVAAAARQPDAPSAAAEAQQVFDSVVATYPLLRTAKLDAGVNPFGRGASLAADSSAEVDIAGESIAFLPSSITLRAHATAVIEPYRSRP